MGRTDQRTAVGFDKDVTQEMGGTVMKMWIARAESGSLTLYQTEPQQEVSMLTGGIYWNDRLESFKIDDRLFPEVTFENSPMEVELVIKK